MSKMVLHADGSRSVPVNGFPIDAIIADRVREATIPATFDEEGKELTPAIAPDEADVAVEVTEADLKAHPWRLALKRADRLAAIEALCLEKLREWDVKALRAWEEGKDPSEVKTAKDAIRAIPASAKAHLETLTDADEIAAYLPAVLE